MKYEIELSDALFRQKIIRDLRGLIYDPLILESTSANELQFKMQHMVEIFIKKYPDRLERMLSRPDPKLPVGKWYEYIFLAAIRITFPFAQVHHSVKDGYGGELDFVITGLNKTIHLECAVKFFLHHHNLGFGLNSYLGPAGSDRLDLKFQKLADVQLQRNIPDSFDVAGPVSKILWMGGRIHEPLSEPSTNQCLQSTRPMPPPMNPNPLLGYWGSTTQLLASLLETECIYKLPRQWRITSIDGLSRSDLSVFKIMADDEILAEPIMTSRVSFDGDYAVERGRGFVSSCW